jgi:hypothetical protein
MFSNGSFYTVILVEDAVFFFDWVHIMRTGAKPFFVLQPMSILALFSRPSCFSLSRPSCFSLKRAVNFCDYPQEKKKKFLKALISISLHDNDFT